MPLEQTGYPQYRGKTGKDTETIGYLQQLGGRRAFSSLMDKIYFVFAGIASIWLSVDALLVAASSSWWSILLILVVWAFFAYLTLPRLHRILTTLYVPTYFIGRAQTSDGLLGDPINLALRAESVDVHTAMEKAGWHRAEPVTLASSWRIVVNTIRRRPYPTAPVSPLYLFGRSEDFAYQQEVDGSPEKRHHVRFWKTPEGWKLPGGGDVDWLAAATFDRAVGLSLFTFQVTHKIDAETDMERDYVIDTVRFCNPEAELEVIKDFSTGYHSRNGGGDAIVTDGDLPILDLHRVVKEDLAIPDNSPQSQYSHHRRPWELVETAPRSLWVAGFFVCLVAILQSALSVPRLGEANYAQKVLDFARNYDLLDFVDQNLLVHLNWLALVGLVCLSLVQVWLAVGAMRGRNRARRLILALLSISFLVTAIRLELGNVYGGAPYVVFVLMASHVFALLEFTSDAAINYTHYQTTKDKTAQPGSRIS